MDPAGDYLADLCTVVRNTTPGLVALNQGEVPPSRDTFVGCHCDLTRLARLRALLDHLIDQLAG